MANVEIHNMAGHLIRRLQQISTSVFQRRTSELGLDMTSVQFAALNTISRNPGIDQATLAGMIAFDRATIGGVVERLEQKGLITRTVSARDKRAREISLSADGAKTLEMVTPTVKDLQKEILSGLNDAEAKEFLRLAAKAAHGANALSRAPLQTGKSPD